LLIPAGIIINNGLKELFVQRIDAIQLLAVELVLILMQHADDHFCFLRPSGMGAWRRTAAVAGGC
jgi:hypothetical protein